MNKTTKKWLFTKLSSVILIPFMAWLIINITKIYDNDYQQIVEFFSTQPSKILFSVFVVIAYFFFAHLPPGGKPCPREVELASLDEPQEQVWGWCS